MSNSKYAKGPWSARSSFADESPWGVQDADGYWVCEVFDSAFDPRDDINSKARDHACLFAAAPDLLMALKQAFEMLGEQELKDVFGYEWHGISRAAIAKAEGAQQ